MMSRLQICAQILLVLTLNQIIASPPCDARKLYSVNNETVPEEVYTSQKTLETYVREGRYQEGETLTAELVSKYPRLASVHFLRAFVLDKANKNEEATREAKISANMNPNFADTWLLLGSLLYVRGKLSDALQAYNKFIEIAPKDHPQFKMVSDARAMLKRAIATKNRMGNIPDDGTNYLGDVTAGGVIRWGDNSMPLKIYIETGDGIKGYRPVFNSYLKNSFAAWSKATGEKVKFRFLEQPAGADIRCKWTDDPSRLAEPGEGGHTQYGIRSTGMVEGEIVLLTYRPNIKIDDATMRYVCLHEVGHALGLHGHSTDPKDIMFLATKLYRTDEPKLTERDARTLVLLYSLQPTSLKPDFDQEVPDTPVAKAAYLNNLGNKALQEHDYQLAIEKFKEALIVRPGYQLAYRNLALAICNSSVPLINSGNSENYKKAVELLEQAIKMQENEPKVDNLLLSLNNYKAVLQRLGREEEVSKIQQKIDKLKGAQTN